MYCNKCGTQNENDAVFCKQCGNDLNSETIEEIEVVDTQTSQINNEAHNHILWKLGMILSLVGIAILGAIVLIGLVIYGQIYLYDGYDFTGRLCTLSFILILLGVSLCVIGAVSSHAFAQLWSKKKGQIIVTSVLAIVCCFVIASSYLAQKTSLPSPSYGSSQSSNKLTISDKEKIAEQQALKKILEWLKMLYKQYDADATRYKLGSITHSGNKFTVNGTLYLYDKYGSLKDTATFSVDVEVKDSGVSFANNPIISIK